MQTERNYAMHGQFRGDSPRVGQFRVASRMTLTNPGDSYEEWEPEIIVYLTDPEQIHAIRIVTPDGNTHHVEREAR